LQLHKQEDRSVERGLVSSTDWYPLALDSPHLWFGWKCNHSRWPGQHISTSRQMLLSMTSVILSQPYWGCNSGLWWWLHFAVRNRCLVSPAAAAQQAISAAAL